MPKPASPPPYPAHANILALRESGWTVPQIAERLGASARTVSRWAAGYTRPLPMFEREIAKLVEERST